MVYKASELLAKLNYLTLVGKENGELIWMGKDKDWNGLQFEEEAILRDHEINKMLNPKYE
jgi:hypothetical protein